MTEVAGRYTEKAIPNERELSEITFGTFEEARDTLLSWGIPEEIIGDDGSFFLENFYRHYNDELPSLIKISSQGIEVLEIMRDRKGDALKIVGLLSAIVLSLELPSLRTRLQALIGFLGR